MKANFCKYESEEVRATVYEKCLIKRAIRSIRKCAEETKDMETMLTLIKLCKYIAGDDFKVTLEID